jgi:thiosulfate/3-mercaptopyruvate sulfurtransferase
VTGPDQHARKGTGSYPYREKSDYVLQELDLRPGDVVVDIGAGDGWWSERMAKAVGADGVIYAAEVEKNKVEEMKKRLAGQPQVRPYLCPTDGTGLSEGTCDLAFFSQSYHHLSHDTHVDYLKHLRTVLRRTGRVCIIERYAPISSRGHGSTLSELIDEAEEAGWVPVRCELMTGTYHFIAIFVQRDLFPPEPASPAKTPNLLIEADALKRQLADANLRVLDVRSGAEYTKAHIPGAVRVDAAAWRKVPIGPNAAQETPQWAALVGGLGIDHRSRVVVYGAALPDVARVWWALRYLGAADVRMLNGGWKAWESAHGALQTAVPKVTARVFEPKLQPNRVVELSELKSLVKNPDVRIVDVRTPKEYAGETAASRGGHIPGAVHLEWTQLVGEDGRFKAPDQIRKLCTDRGVPAEKTAIPYCQTGGRASVAALALELAGFKEVRNFYGSWEQWSADAEAPVEKP